MIQTTFDSESEVVYICYNSQEKKRRERERVREREGVNEQRMQQRRFFRKMFAIRA